MKIFVLVGSLRKGSLNRSLFEAYREINAPAGAEFIEGRFDEFPPYDADLQERGMPEAVLRMGEQVRACNAVMFFSPEYNYSVPGALKNALDWISRLPNQPFAGKPAAIAGASPGKLGTGRMQYHLRQIGVFLDLHFLNRPEIMVSAASQVIDSSGKLTDETTRAFLKKHYESFEKFAARFS